MDPHNGQLPVGLIAQLVEHCTGMAEVRVQDPFRPFSPYCLSSDHNCKDQLHGIFFLTDFLHEHCGKQLVLLCEFQGL